MKMEKVSLKTILESEKEIEKVSELDLTHLPIKTFYWLGKLSKLIKNECSEYKELETKLIRELGVEIKDEDGNVKMISVDVASDENKKLFFEKTHELKQEEIELEFTKLKLEDFKVGDKLVTGLTPKMIGVLDWLITE